ncbi:hypothetical protein SDC9_86662 [bioreactor metagenome]|uniref:Uncharacterized protein n=1 Tax=bioreactor metagenome TaxID=1076179 RepID=A0A644ZQZ5_9ZZZZ
MGEDQVDERGVDDDDEQGVDDDLVFLDHHGSGVDALHDERRSEESRRGAAGNAEGEKGNEGRSRRGAVSRLGRGDSLEGSRSEFLRLAGHFSRKTVAHEGREG